MLPFPGPSRTVVLVDGEHYPPVVRAALDELRSTGRKLVAGALLGGAEKLPPGDGRLDGRSLASQLGLPELVRAPTLVEALTTALDRFGPDEVVDLSDDPILDARKRMLLVAHTLARGIPYRGADFTFAAPARPRLSTKPSLAVIGSGKRTGKTAIAAEIARITVQEGWPAVLVAMGRGGPEEPELLDPEIVPVTVDKLLDLAAAGRHAASDHLEDALMAGIATVGTRRCGGGLAGVPASTTFQEGVVVANERPEPFMILEGSGTVVPPIHADVTICVVPAHADLELVVGYLGAYRLLISDVIIITGSEPWNAGVPEHRPGILEQRIREIVPDRMVLRTTFRPRPLEPIAGENVFFATTASPVVTPVLAAHLESCHGATVVGWSTGLADRPRLVEDLAAAPRANVLVTELKAAAVDVATRIAVDRDMRVVYCENEVVAVAGDRSLAVLVPELITRARRRYAAHASAGQPAGGFS